MQEGLTAYLGAFVDELARSGVRDIVVSPGSRSTPLAILVAEHPEMKIWINIDERSAAFFALGMAKGSRKPVALLCTSGTAAANYMPAVVEAYLSRVPLLVLTADRPHELRDVGAPQTINQIGLYGSHVKWFSEMPIPDSAPNMIRHSRIVAARAVSVASASPQGPVHLNFPLREPLIPDLDSSTLWGGARDEKKAYVSVIEGQRSIEETALLALADELSRLKKGMIICGPLDKPSFADAITKLSEQLGYPVLADPLSQLRSGSHDKSFIVDGYDAFLRDERVVGRLKPEVIIRFGAMPVSKPLLLFLNKYPDTRHVVVDEGAGWREPTLQATDMIYAEPTAFCHSISAYLAEKDMNKPTDWLEEWLSINAATSDVLSRATDFDALFEGQLFLELKEVLPPQSTLFVGNSMPIRDLDTFYGNNNAGIRVMGNRGANGIDGLISTALGISAAGERVVLVLGDLSFYHDMNGLLAAKLHSLDATMIVVNNDGGGIFSFLPQAGVPQHFEQLFGTPIGLDYTHAAAMYGGTFIRATTWDSFREHFRSSVESKGLQIIELPTDRESNVTMHRDVWRSLFEKLTPLLPGGAS